MKSHNGYCQVWLGDDQVLSRNIFGVDPGNATLTMKKRKPSELSVQWGGVDLWRLANPYILENVVIHFVFGYFNGEAIEDTFVIKGMSVAVSGACASVSITANDKGIGLAEYPSRVVLQDVRLSDVAVEAAKLLGLEANVTQTQIVHSSVSFANSTVGQILEKMAEGEDMHFYIEKDILHLEPIDRYNKDAYPLYWLSDKGSSDVLSINISQTAVSKKAGKEHKTVGKTESGDVQQAKETGPIDLTVQDVPPEKAELFTPNSRRHLRHTGNSTDSATITKYRANASEWNAYQKELNSLSPEKREAYYGIFKATEDGYSAKVAAAEARYAEIEKLNRERIKAEREEQRASKKTDRKSTGAGFDLNAQLEKAAAKVKKDTELRHARESNGTSVDQAAYAAEMNRIETGRKTAQEVLRRQVQDQLDFEAAERESRLQSVSMTRDPAKLKARNIAWATFVKWKSRQATIAIQGKFIRPGKLIVIKGLTGAEAFDAGSGTSDWKSSNVNSFEGPWSITSTQISWSGSLSVQLSAETYKPPKDDAFKDTTADAIDNQTYIVEVSTGRKLSRVFTHKKGITGIQTESNKGDYIYEKITVDSSGRPTGKDADRALTEQNRREILAQMKRVSVEPEAIESGPKQALGGYSSEYGTSEDFYDDDYLGE